jgi:hypothetical protein
MFLPEYSLKFLRVVAIGVIRWSLLIVGMMRNPTYRGGASRLIHTGSIDFEEPKLFQMLLFIVILRHYSFENQPLLPHRKGCSNIEQRNTDNEIYTNKKG